MVSVLEPSVADDTNPPVGCFYINSTYCSLPWDLAQTALATEGAFLNKISQQYCRQNLGSHVGDNPVVTFFYKTVEHFAQHVSDCVEMYQNGQDENVAFFWHQICRGARLRDSELLAMARDTKKTDPHAFFLSGCQEENHPFSHCRSYYSFRSPLTPSMVASCYRSGTKA